MTSWIATWPLSHTKYPLHLKWVAAGKKIMRRGHRATARVTGYQMTKSITWYAHLLDCPTCNHLCGNQALYNFARSLNADPTWQPLIVNTSNGKEKHWVKALLLPPVRGHLPPSNGKVRLIDPLSDTQSGMVCDAY
jgi:hypothetical protein